MRVLLGIDCGTTAARRWLGIAAGRPSPRLGEPHPGHRQGAAELTGPGIIGSEDFPLSGWPTRSPGDRRARRHLVTRRQRANPRVVKRKMSNFGVKRATHRGWPQPTKPIDQAVTIVRDVQPPAGRGTAARHAHPARRQWRPRRYYLTYYQRSGRRPSDLDAGGRPPPPRPAPADVREPGRTARDGL